MRIGLFDSGIGGLTVLKTLINKYPNNEYFYYGDTLNVPYGNKSKDELCILAKKNIDFLISKWVELIIIACGTLSSNCLDYLKNESYIFFINEYIKGKESDKNTSGEVRLDIEENSDISDALQKVIDDSNGDTSIIIPEGTYKLTKGIKVNKKGLIFINPSIQIHNQKFEHRRLF